jgi:hypothetical protein
MSIHLILVTSWRVLSYAILSWKVVKLLLDAGANKESKVLPHPFFLSVLAHPLILVLSNAFLIRSYPVASVLILSCPSFSSFRKGARRSSSPPNVATFDAGSDANANAKDGTVLLR